MKTIYTNILNKYGAGSKAPEDIYSIICNNYDIESKSLIVNKRNNKFFNKFLIIIYAIRRFLELCKMNYKEYYFLQSNCFDYPFFLPSICSKIIKNKNVIILIHDINGLRYGNNKKLEKEIKILSSAKYIISHNNNMTDFLIEKGIDKKKIINLECFDYICSSEKQCNTSESNNIVYAGNLIKSKSSFLYELDSKNMNFNMNVYGSGVEKGLNSNINYKGIYESNNVRSALDGKIGLIWDGEINVNQNNLSMNYTKYNNPHKLSCYLAADLPVIVWKDSAIAEFVLKYNIGYLIDNIYDINDLDFKDYEEKKKNAIKIGKKIRSGFFTKRAMDEVLKRINKGD